MTGRLTTHVLDLVHGRPAAGIAIALARISDDGGAVELARIRTNADGRAAAPLLSGPDFTVGRYELSFAVADYFRDLGTPLADPPFLDVVRIGFGVADADIHHHVPLLVSPWAYSTYRGS